MLPLTHSEVVVLDFNQIYFARGLSAVRALESADSCINGQRASRIKLGTGAACALISRESLRV